MKSAQRNRYLQPTFFKAVLCVSFLSASFLLHFRGGKPRSPERTPLISAPATLSRLPESPKLGVQPFGPFPLVAAAAQAKPFTDTKPFVSTKKRVAKKRQAPKVTIAKIAATIVANENASDVVEKIAESVEVDSLLEETFPADSDEMFALNVIDGVDLQVEEALSEPSLETAILSSPTSPLLVDSSLSSDLRNPRVGRLIETVGLYQKNDFADIRENLAMLKQEAATLATNPTRSATPAPELVSPERGPGKVAGLLKRDLVRPAPLQTAVAKGVPDEVRPVLLARSAERIEALDETEEPQAVETEKVSPLTRAPLDATAELAASAASQVATSPSIAAPAVKAVASLAGATLSPMPSLAKSMTTQTPRPAEERRIVTAQVSQLDAAPKARTLADAARVHSPVAESDYRDTEIEGTVYGQLEVEDSVAAFLQREQGHIELYLHPVASRLGEDTIFVDYTYPDEAFEFDATGLVGEYRLAAGIYIRKETTQYAQVWFSNNISAGTFREKIRFEITEKDVRAARSNALPTGQKISLRATLFQGAAGDHRQAQPIPNGEVRVVGFPEWGSFRSDRDGNFLIPSVPGASQLVLETKATGYYPSFHTIPIFTTPVYSPLYLIARDKVETITKYFTKNSQMPGQALVMGRVFNPRTRRPAKGEEVSLSFERNRALYFDAFPDKWLPSTTETGLFGFFNVAPSVRFVQRSKDQTHSMLMNLRPDTAQYVEIGRAGAKTLKARLLERNSHGVDRPIGFAKIRLVGDRRQEVFSDGEGNFDIAGLDLPVGVLTIEIEAEGYPRTWQTIAWNPREPERRMKLFLMPRLKVSAKAGAIYGDAREKFFSKKVKCLFVSLMDAQGRPMDKSHGPFRFDTETYQSTSRTLELEDKVAPAGQVCLSASTPNFTFQGLAPGEYLLKWHDERFRTKRTRVIHVSAGRLSVVVN